MRRPKAEFPGVSYQPVNFGFETDEPILQSYPPHLLRVDALVCIHPRKTYRMIACGATQFTTHIIYY